LIGAGFHPEGVEISCGIMYVNCGVQNGVIQFLIAEIDENSGENKVLVSCDSEIVLYNNEGVHGRVINNRI